MARFDPIKRASRWLRKHPILAFLLVLAGFVFKDLPEWLASIWSLRSSRPFVIVVQEKMQSCPHFSVYWITTPLGWLLLGGIFYLLLTGRRSESERRQPSDAASNQLQPHDAIELRNTMDKDGCSESWLHDIADAQANNLRDSIEIIGVRVWTFDLNAALPTIKCGVLIKNRSLFTVTIDEEITQAVLEVRGSDSLKETVIGIPRDQLVISQAHYGTEGVWQDVADVLRSRIYSNGSRLRLSDAYNDMFGDPINGKPKILKII